VISGPVTALGKAETVADVVGITAVRLRAPAAFHSPTMSACRSELVRQARRFTQHPLRVPVYSPIYGRFYRDTDQLAEMVPQHLVMPVRFGPAVRRFHAAGARIFVEVGAGGALGALVHAAFDDVVTPPVTTDLTAASACLRTAEGHRSAGPQVRRRGDGREPLPPDRPGGERP
jgi:acyl transferase domain-containing protein